MNNDQINIDGIKVIQQVINGEQTTDKAYLLIIKDDEGNEVTIQIVYGKIINSVWTSKK